LFRNQFAVSGGCGRDEEEEWEVFCRTADAVVHCDRYCQNHNIPWFVVGKGSNCLFDDRGFDGCIILNRINFVEVLGSGVYRVGSGHAFNILGMLCSRDGFSGLEFASGIPGTVGGAIFMNAGADGQVCVSLGFSRLVCLGNYQHKEEFCFPAGDFYKMVVAYLRASC